MTETITLEPVDDVPPDSRICHYDELGDSAKEKLPALAEGCDVSVDGAVVDGFHDCDLVKYTEYYELSLR